MYIFEYNKLRKDVINAKDKVCEKAENLAYRLRKYPWYYKLFAILIVIGLLWIGGVASQLYFYVFLQANFRGLGNVNILNPILCIGSYMFLGFEPFLVGFLIDDVIICGFSFYWYKNHKFRPLTVDIQRGERIIRHVTNGGSLATGHPAFIEDMEDNFIVTSHPERYSTPVYGKWKDEDDDRFILAKEVKEGSNQNSIVFGAGGSRKTRGEIIPWISQLAKKGVHMIITDPSTEIYSKTYYRLKDEGYTIKVINTIDPLLSNGWNFIGDIGTDSDFAFQFASAMIENSREPGAKTDQYWDNTMINFLTALIIYVNTLPPHKANIKEVVKLNNTDCKDLRKLFGKLPRTSPGHMHFDTFWNADTNRDKIKSNLGLALKIFYQPLLSEMLSTNDIHVTDFLAPKEEKIALFIITSEQSDVYSMVAGLFMDACFKVLSEKAKTLSGHHLPNPVHFICDEFANIGHIVSMGKKLSVSRKYWFIVHMIFQSMPQFLNRYDENEVGEIFSNCNNKLVLSADDNDTAKYFEEFFGKMEVLHFQDTTNAPVLNTTASVRGSVAAQPIWTQDDILRLDSNYMLLKWSKAPVADIKKIDYTELPEFKALYAKYGGEEQSEVSISDFKGTVRDPFGDAKRKYTEDNSEQTETTEDKVMVEGFENPDNFFFREDFDDTSFDESAFDESADEGAKPAGKDTSTSQVLETSKSDPLGMFSVKGDISKIKVEKPKKNTKEKKVVTESLYNVDCTPRVIADYKTITKKTAQDAQMKLTSYFENEHLSLNSINEIPNIPKHIDWNPLLAHYKSIIMRDVTRKVVFNNSKFNEINGLPVTTVSFKSKADFIDLYLPGIQLRAVGEMINISELTNSILSKINIPEPFRLDCWTVVTNSNGKTKKVYSGDSLRISNSHITLIPHFAEKE